MAARLISLCCVLLGGLLFWAALGSDTPKAYFFPQMLAIAMAALGALMLAIDLRAAGKAQPLRIAIPWVKIAPGMAVLAAFMLVAETVGFYLSSWLAFMSIGVLYAPTATRFATAKRCLPISIAFLAVLYLVFWMLLSVRLPSGFAF